MLSSRRDHVFTMHSFQVKVTLKYSQRLMFTRTSTSGRYHLQLCWGYVKQQANILFQTTETAQSCRTTLSYGFTINSCEHKFFWSGALTSWALCQELMLSQCHQLIMFQAPEPVMRTAIIMFRSLLLCSYADFCQLVANHFGVQKPTAGKLVIEASEAASVVPLPKSTPGEHCAMQTSIPPPAVWSHLQVLHSCPLSFHCIY